MKNTDKKLIVPASVRPGDTIAIVTPASAMESRYIDSLIEKLHNRGFKTKVMPHAYGNEFGTYPADDDKRLADIMDAFKDSEVKAILCSRGGYGMVHLLPHLDADTILKNPKWFVGFSDISDMHAYLHHLGVASMHGPMAAHIVDEPDNDTATNLLFKYLSEGLPQKVEIAPHKYNHNGTAKGRLVGGNLLTLTGLAETPYDVLNACRNEDAILFIEDVSEQIYAVE
ncbi:MAG: LD-carboxypeptidase, partial [Bacteroidales bacterium]|nr:LD-carboxypeptidase [Bacteroidales bacterium]